MSKLSFILCFLLVGWGINAQEASFTFSYEYFYPTISNVITVESSSILCEDLLVSSDCGRLLILDSCSYVFYPNLVGECKIELNSKKNDRVLYSKTINASPWPDPKVSFYENNNTINKGIIKAWDGLYVPISFGDISGSHKIVYYNYELVRKENLLIKGTSNVARFPKRLEEKISEIEIGDKLYFSNIHVIMPGEKLPRKISNCMIVVE